MQSEAPSDLPIRQDCKAAEPRRAVVLPTARIPADPGEMEGICSARLDKELYAHRDGVPDRVVR